jgi:predicted metal-dependent HD superfamily phosphohydrolase
VNDEVTDRGHLFHDEREAVQGMEKATLENRLWQIWWRSLQPYAVAAEAAETAFVALVQAYSSPDRYYHTLTHIDQMLVVLKSLQAQAQNLSRLQLATWFHDAVYRSQATDNEEQSANYAAEVLRSFNLPIEEITMIGHLILCTKHHHADANDIDAQILLDADLSILGTHEKQYWQYAKAIRQEYAWVSEDAYCEGRRRVLESFLHRDRLFLTETMFTRFEAIARHNLRAELQQLARSGA